MFIARTFCWGVLVLLALASLPCFTAPVVTSGPHKGDKVYLVVNMRLIGTYNETHAVTGRKPKGSKKTTASESTTINYRCRVNWVVRENTGKDSDALVLDETGRNEMYDASGHGSYNMFDETWVLNAEDKPEFFSKQTAESSWKYPHLTKRSFVDPDVTLSPRDKRFKISLPVIMPSDGFTPTGSTQTTIRTQDDERADTMPDPARAGMTTAAMAMALQSMYGAMPGGVIRDDGVKKALSGAWTKPGEAFSLTRSTGYEITEADMQKLTGEEFGDPKEEDNEVKTASLRGRLQITYTLSYNMEPEELEAVIIPPSGYEKSWLPEGGSDEKTPGKSLAVKVKLQVKGQPDKAPSQGAKFTFKLTDVSKEPGTCLNYPYESGSTEQDLRIRQEDNKQLKVQGENTAATLGDEEKESTLVIQCYDWGAYGKLQVTADLEYGGTLQAHVEGENDLEYLSIPMDKNENHVADAWEKEYGIDGKDEKADDEDKPKGDGHKGDGLTCYEEFRGLMEGGKHIRCNPLRKDYFISSGLGQKGEAGIKLFENLSGLEVHAKLNTDELGKDRTINRNSTHKRGSGQHGVNIEVDHTANGVSNADGGGPGTPKHVDRISVAPDMLVGKDSASTIAHELFHACSVYHHGSGDYVVRGWSRMPKPGKPDEYEIRECAASLVEGKPVPDFTGEFPITVFDEQGNELKLAWLEPKTVKYIYLAVKHGEHSGYERCLMRYNIAQAYVSELESPTAHDGIRRVFNAELKPTDEPSGTELCCMEVGKDFNRYGRDPEPRYGSAAEGAGNCTGQICVNDQYDHTPVATTRDGRTVMVRSAQ